MDVSRTIKIFAAQENISVAELVRRFAKYSGKEYSTQSFSNRLRNGTVHYNEVVQIAKMLGYKIKFEKTDDD